MSYDPIISFKKKKRARGQIFSVTSELTDVFGPTGQSAELTLG